MLTAVLGIAEKVKNFAVVYLCDIDQMPDFNTMSSCTYSGDATTSTH